MDKETYEQYQMQDYLQQNQLDSQRSVYAPQLQEQIQQAQAILVEQTDPKKIIQEIMLVLRGLDYRNGKYVRVARPKMNSVGLDSIWSWLKGFINQSIILSHFTEPEIRNMMKELSDDLVEELALNRLIYGIENQTDLDLINDLILTNIKAALNRAKEQNEKNWLGRISIEQIGQNKGMPNVKKEGFLSKFRL